MNRLGVAGLAVGLGLAAVAGPVAAQTRTGEDRGAEAVQIADSTADATREHATAAIVAPVIEAAPRARASSLRTRIGRVVTGGVIGGWLGFMASQIVVSDWEVGPRSDVEINRAAWAAGGVLLGAVTGRLVSPGGAGPDIARPASGRSVITLDDIERTGAATVLELITALRPEWLRTRGATSWFDVDSEARVIVYLDHARLGGTYTLGDLPAANVERVEFFDAAAATFLFGAGHSYGAIQVTTVGSRSGRSR